MTLDDLVLHYREQGYTGTAGGALISPNGFEHRGVVKSGLDVFLPEQIALRLYAMKTAQRERIGKRRLDLTGRVHYTTTRDAIGR